MTAFLHTIKGVLYIREHVPGNHKQFRTIKYLGKIPIEDARRELRRWQQQVNPIYRTIVIDPPWPVEKIARDVRPNQVDFDYSTMSIEEITAFPLKKFIHKDGCHIYLWTTHKHLPAACGILTEWGAKYQCLLTWVKNVGFTPFSFMYSTELVLFGTVGNLALIKKGERLDFKGKVREHSRKPDEFYDLVKKVSPDPRIDIFSREKRDGFDQWGCEANKFTELESVQNGATIYKQTVQRDGALHHQHINKSPPLHQIEEAVQ